MYHCINQKALEFFCLIFKTNCACHNRDTRQSDDLNVPSWRLDVRKFGFRIHGANMWNNIPDYIKNVQSVYIFKQRFRNYLIESRSSVTSCYDL